MRMLVIGAGKMAKAIAYDFCRQDDVSHVGIVSRNLAGPKKIVKFVKSHKAKALKVNLAKKSNIVRLMRKYDCCVSAVPYYFNYTLAKAAVKAGCHFVDLGGNNVIVDKEFSLNAAAKKRDVCIVPDSGLAPGLVSNLTALAMLDFDEKVESVKLRVGGLPQKPKGLLEYMLVFSVKGLINEYIEPVQIIKNYKLKTIEPMKDMETIYFKGYGKMEAFPTSGGTSTMSKSFRGKVKNLDYKTIRYTGHAEKIRLLMELGLTSSEEIDLRGTKVSPRAVLENQLVEKYSYKGKDLVLCRVELESRKKKVSYTLIDKETRGLTAMMRCTGFPAATIALMCARGQVLKRGTLKHEFDIPPVILYKELLKKGLKIKKRVQYK